MIIPEENVRDLKEIPDNIKQDLQIKPVKGLKDLQGFQIRHGDYSLTPCILLRAAIAVIPPPDKSAR
ncbi:S16 family serine protease, partial [Klebsiella pneumoniae]|uniref:S16 family serine protease n=1 Tax=Klebsiella pneumoniae TaxID=573 RepID=UPI002730B862